MTKPYHVTSRNIVAVSYDELEEILAIEFKLNVIHRYLEVPIDEFVAFMKADDMDDFFFNFIQHNYHYETFE
jgi:hypothetical protein